MGSASASVSDLDHRIRAHLAAAFQSMQIKEQKSVEQVQEKLEQRIKQAEERATKAEDRLKDEEEKRIVLERSFASQVEQRVKDEQKHYLAQIKELREKHERYKTKSIAFENEKKALAAQYRTDLARFEAENRKKFEAMKAYYKSELAKKEVRLIEIGALNCELAAARPQIAGQQSSSAQLLVHLQSRDVPACHAASVSSVFSTVPEEPETARKNTQITNPIDRKRRLDSTAVGDWKAAKRDKTPSRSFDFPGMTPKPVKTESETTIQQIGGVPGAKIFKLALVLTGIIKEESEINPLVIMESIIPIIDPSHCFRIIGPDGSFKRHLEAQTDCEIVVRGRGSIRDPIKLQVFRGTPRGKHLDDPLHVWIRAEAPNDQQCAEKLRKATEAIVQRFSANFRFNRDELDAFSGPNRP